ncbi:unnamed protein product [Pedinophyceae sp. YPF-701]|nr:unnamed protein product [Pedinophyceae sp. YPF-701]
MSRYGVMECNKIVLRYSRQGGSSKGVREFLQLGLEAYRERFPDVPIETKEVNHMAVHPTASADYRNGRKQVISLRNNSVAEVVQHVYFLRSTWGNRVQGVGVSRSSFFAGVKKRVHSENKSIQGQWTPDTFQEWHRP